MSSEPRHALISEEAMQVSECHVPGREPCLVYFRKSKPWGWRMKEWEEVRFKRHTGTWRVTEGERASTRATPGPS